jgi:PAS domain S-box-containing protein
MRKSTIQFAIGAVLITVVLTFLAIFVVGRYERAQTITSMKSRMVLSSALRANMLSQSIESLRQDARFLASTPAVQGVVRAAINNGFDAKENTTGEQWRKRLQTIFAAFAKNNPDLTLIRFIGSDADGKELVRIDQENGNVIVAQDDQLQAKGGRDYFVAASRLGAGEVYVSDVNLSREHDQLVVPHLKMMRAAIPIYTEDGKFFGEIIVNRNLDLLFSQFTGNSSEFFHLYLANSNGDYLIRPASQNVFGFDLGQQWRWQDDFHPLAKTGNGQDALEEFSSHDGSAYVLQKRISLDPTDAKRFLTLSVVLPENAVMDAVKRAQIDAAFVALLASLTVLAAAYVFIRQKELVSKRQAELAAIVENSRDAIIGKTLQGVVTSWNQGAEEMFGYLAHEAIGKPLLELIVPPDHADEEAEILRKVGRGEKINNRNTVRNRKDGQQIHVAITVSPIISDDGRVVGVAKTVRDISKQAAVEAQIRELNRTLELQVAERTAELRSHLALQRAILENAGYAIIAVDLDGVITLFNPSAERMLGYEASEMIGKCSPVVFHDPVELRERTAEFSAAIGESIEFGFDVFIAKTNHGLPNEHEWTYIRKDGSRIPVLLVVTKLQTDDGTVVGYLGMAADFSARRAAEKALEDNNRFLDTLTTNIPGMVGYWDRNLRCQFANRSYIEWFGKTPEQMRGISLRELVGETVFKENQPFMEGALQGKRQRLERTLVKPDGTLGYILVHYIPDFDGDRVRGVIAVVSDVTQVKMGQIELEKMNHQLEIRSNEAEAASRSKSEFLANMSHEIRTPMNAILGMLQLLQQNGLNKKQTDYAGRAESAARTLLGILNDILDFSRVEAGKLELDPHPFAIDKMLRNIAFILSTNVGEKDVEIVFEIDPAVPDSVIGDDLRLQQVLINLAGNAVKFTEKGEVVLSVSRQSAQDDGIAIRFSIRDTGIGISPEQCQRIFDGFSQAEASTARRFGGSGLGLAISKRLVDMMGGTLDVESEVGKGSIFHFTLKFQETSPIASPDRLALIERAKNLHCLVVDDSLSARQALQGILESFGWVVETVDSGKAAIDLVAEKTLATPYDVIFVDWRMPELDGWETCTRIRQILPSASATIVFMITAHGREFASQRLAEVPALLDGYLVKPVTASMLYDAVLESRIEQAPLVAAVAPATLHKKRLAAMNILIVEDNQTNQIVLRDLLENDGANVTVVDGGQAAIDEIRSKPKGFAVVLMDVQMPEMDGYTATKIIRNDFGRSELPIIAITANAMASDRAAALLAGMNDHVGKPFDLTQLISVILRHAGPERDNPIQAGQTDISESKPVEQEFDIGSALLRLGGNVQIYCVALKGFIQELSKAREEFDEALRHQRRDDAIRIVHTIKGLAGTVGANQLARLAAENEHELRGNLGTAPLQAHDELWHAVENASKTATEHLSRLSPATQIPSTDGASPQDLRDGLSKLCELLNAASFDAVKLHEQYSDTIEDRFPDQGFRLHECMDQLDFVNAKSICVELLRVVAA